MKIGTTQEAKALKAAILNKIFECKSVDALDAKTNEQLKKGEGLLKGFAEDYISYMEICAASNAKPETTEIGKILDDRINNNGLI